MAERVASPVFVGRRTELAALDAALADGTAAAVLIGGEAGGGKSRLVSEFAGRAVASGARVLTGACLALGAESLPYAPFAQALCELAAELGPAGMDELVGGGRAELARLVPELRRPEDESHPSSPSDRSVLFHVVLRAVEALGARAPLVVVVEDLHWADASSRELLGFLIARIRGRVLLVGTYRSDEMHRRHPLRPLLAEAARQGRVVRLELRPLEPDEVAEQLAAILGAPPAPAVLAAVVGRAEGNPFFAEELLAAGGGDFLPASLAEVLAARLEALPAAAQDLVRVAAVAGRQVRHELLAAVAGQSGAELAGALREATAHQVLVADATGSYAFRHALLAEAAYAELLPAERAPLHAACAAALSAHPEWAATPARAAGELAHHYAAAHDPARALTSSVRAAEAAVDAYAFAEGLALYEQALALWDGVPDAAQAAGVDRAQLLERASLAAHLAGAAVRAVALIKAALDEIDQGREPARAALLYERLARLLWRDDADASLAANRAAVALMPAQASAERARVIGGEARTLLLAGRYHESCARAREAISVAQAAGAKREEGYALNTLGASLGRLGETEQAVRMLEQALVIAESDGSVEDIWRAYANLGVTLEECGQLDRAVACDLDGAATLERLGYVDGAAHLRGGVAGKFMVSGLWDEADRMVEEVLAGTPNDVTAWRTSMAGGTVALRRGAFADAHRHLDRARALAAKAADTDYTAQVGAACAELALAEGLVDEARSIVERTLPSLAETDADDAIALLVVLGLRGEAEMASERTGRGSEERVEGARARADCLVARATAMMTGSKEGSRSGTRQGKVLKLWWAAELARAHGRDDPGAWAQVAEGWAALSRPYEAAYARWREAEARLAAGDKDTAAGLLREAFARAGAMGAAPLSREIEGLARRARVRLGTGDPPRGPGPGQGATPAPAPGAGLTRRETEVLALVAAGHTNSQIAEALYMSEKTASVHVSRILTKLGVANRGQAAAVAHRLQLVDRSGRTP